MLNFADLQESLRRLLSARIETGELTGVGLARRTGMRQSHISNFLNRKRAFSVKGMDRVLRAEKISILDLVPPDEIASRAAIPPASEGDYANLVLLQPQHAARPRPLAADAVDDLKFPTAILRRIHSNLRGQRASWMRFVLLKPTRADCLAMSPRLSPGCTVLLDRHHNALAPYRRRERSIFAVWKDGQAVIRYVRREGDVLLLRPQAQKSEVELLRVQGPVHDAVIGRVAYVGMEL